MPSFTGNKYPEELRALRAQYPNTQFDSHGRVIGGMPLDQYNAQPANPAVIPASVRTYSQFDPATGTWIKHTNGAAPVQSPVQGMTPTGTPGILLRSKQQPQPTQVMRPLPRNNQKANTSKPNSIEVAAAIAAAAGNPAKLDITPNFNKLGWGTQEVVPKLYTEGLTLPNPIRRGVRIPTQVDVDPAEIGQSAPVAEVTPIIKGDALRRLGNGFLDVFWNPDPDYFNRW